MIRSLTLAAALAALLASGARAQDYEIGAPKPSAEFADGTWIVGVAAGLGAPEGGARRALGRPYVFSGQALYVPQSEYAVGLLVDRALFAAKGGVKADSTAVCLVDRAHIRFFEFAELVPYALIGLGYAENHAELPGARARGSGPAVLLGLGGEFLKSGPLGWGAEFRLERFAGGLAPLGLGGITAAILELKGTWRFSSPDYFSP